MVFLEQYSSYSVSVSAMDLYLINTFLYRLKNYDHTFIYIYISRVNHPQNKTINELEETENDSYKL